VRPSLVVLDAPLLDGAARFGQRPEPRRIQALVAQPPVELLGERVLHRLPGLDEQQRDAAPMRLRIEHLARELRLVVQHRRRQAARAGEPLEHGDDTQRFTPGEVQVISDDATCALASQLCFSDSDSSRDHPFGPRDSIP
jgi:hypothetical protein